MTRPNLRGQADKAPVVQPVPRPATLKEYEQIRHKLIDTHGNPLAREFCASCNHIHYTVEPCAREVPCPSCGSRRARCVRPSEHDNVEWHRARQDAFEALCAEREAAGLPQVARWAEAVTSASDLQQALF